MVLRKFSENSYFFREGWIESRLRFLVLNLEQTPNMQYAIPYPSGFQLEIKTISSVNEEGQETSKNEHGSCFFIGLQLNIQKSSQGGPKTIDLTPAVTDFTQAVKEWPPKSPSMDIRIKYVKR
jgi:poly(A) polymerase Pap1